MEHSHYQHLTLAERRCIYYWRHYDKVSLREMARRLGRNHSTISRELKRNSGCWCDQYYHKPAHHMAQVRLKQRAQRQRLKSDRTRDYVEAHLQLGWTPELISGRLKLESNIPCVSHEAIYQYIYKEAREWISCLPRRHKRRRTKYPYRTQPIKITSKTMISERPKRINDRTELGHWESDTVESVNRKGGLNVLVERVSRFVHITKLNSKRSVDTQRAIVDRLKFYPGNLVQSITYDNGVENAAHEATNQILKTQSYFCAPYHSWEKGSVEQVNGLIRRFIPKKTDIAKIGMDQISYIEYLLNHRPRKCLGYRTPYEILQERGGALLF